MSPHVHPPLSLAVPVAVAVAYFGCATLTLAFGRYTGGVAEVWVASALLIARLSSLTERRWGPDIALSAIASALATGLVGLGWVAAVPLAAVNMLEAVLGAMVLRHLVLALERFDAFDLIAGYYLGMGIVVPLTSACAAALTCALVCGLAPETTLLHWLIGHAAGIVTILPLTIAVARCVRSHKAGVSRGEQLAAVTIPVVLAVLVMGVFLVPDAPPALLALPAIFALYIACWTPPLVAFALPPVLALTGGALTAAGFGPMASLDLEPGDRMQVFLLYAALVALATLPIVIVQERRRRVAEITARRRCAVEARAGRAGDIVFQLDAGRLIRFCSPGVAAATGHMPLRLLGRDFAHLVAPEHRERVSDAHRTALLWPGEERRVEFLLLPLEGLPRWFESRFSAHGRPHDGLLGGEVTCVTRDITARKRREEALLRGDGRDPLTGLATRRALLDAMERREEVSWLVHMDIVRFGAVTDALGHAAGDDVLRALSGGLRSLAEDAAGIARVGGDEFAILLGGHEAATANELAARVAGWVEETTFLTCRGPVRIVVRVGTARVGGDAEAALALAAANAVAARGGEAVALVSAA